ncbi:methionyl-tRNA formyltransferase [Aquihabitans sp. McL0605]|uniref:methionyl-tRNA formyltransferase n=1 Tax=Aquihabitans sp. McL0605 TaxID=3415671 RepID=UPI003CF02292
MDPAGAPGEPPALPAPPAHPRRLVFLGTPEMAVAPLEALHGAGFDVALVVTGPDKRRGRGSATTPNPVKLAALGLGLPISHDIADVAGAGADLGVVVAFGQIIRRPVLEALPMVNLHFSLLPRWRGAAPVERALLAGDEHTGVCVMAVEEGLDTGGVYACEEIAIRRSSTATELGEQLTGIGSRLLVEALTDGLGTPEPQVGEPTYAHKLGPDDRHLRWDRSADELDRIVRVGGAWTTFRGKRLKVIEAKLDTDPAPLGPPGSLRGTQVAAATGSLHLVTVQPEGKGPTAAEPWLRGARVEPGERLGDHGSEPT